MGRSIAEYDPGAPTILLEARSQDTQDISPRQGEIGKALVDEGVNVLYVDFENPASFTADGMGLEQVYQLGDGRIVPLSLSSPIHPDTAFSYRIRDLGTQERPRFTEYIRGYNNARLADATLGRISMFKLLEGWNLGSRLPQTIVINPAEPLVLPEGYANFFIKAGADRFRSDVSSNPLQRAHLIPREKVRDSLATLGMSGNVMLQPITNLNSPEAFTLLSSILDPVTDIEQRPVHMLRIYHMTHDQTPGAPTVAEVRFMRSEDIGRPRSAEDPPYQLVEPEALFGVLPELASLHMNIAEHIASEFGTNNFAADFFINGDHNIVLNGIHLRAFSPMLNDTDISRRTIDVEVNYLLASA